MLRPVLTVFLALAAAASTAFAAPPSEYSAEVTTKLVDRAPVTGTIHVTPSAARYDTPELIAITRWDLKVTYVLQPATKKYAEKKLSATDALRWGFDLPMVIDQASEGKEKLGDAVLDKYKVTVPGENGSAIFYRWYGEGVPVRSQPQNGGWVTQISNVKPGRQDAALFEVPKDYKRVAAPGE